MITTHIHCDMCGAELKESFRYACAITNQGRVGNAWDFCITCRDLVKAFILTYDGPTCTEHPGRK